jgi:FlaA1/EpsC-like NDP-sugar epimerase
VAAIAAKAQARDILVMDARLTGRELRHVMTQCEQAGLTLKVIPAMEDVLKGSGLNRIPLRDIDINDLLRREPVQMDSEGIGHLLRSRTVMVTGAGGSIGSEICRQVLKFQPRELLLVERFENNLFLIERELRPLCGDVVLKPCIADVTDKARMRVLFESHSIDVVFHAAAHKHVPMMEHNPGEAIKNNVLGTKAVADLADQFGVSSFVLISTDKAVNPSSVMGVTKQLAERCVYTLSQNSRTRFVAVRFGNVLGSAGSVIPVFQEQIRKGGPITVTHPDMERFFMTIPEASQLVLQAAALGKGGEIFVLDMGEPVKIVDLARDLIHLSGLGPDDIEIQFTGTRPGEKLYEELYLEDEKLLPSAHPKIRMASHRRYSAAEIALALQQLAKLVHEPESTIRRTLRDLVPEYASPQDARAVELEIARSAGRKAA